MEKVLIAENLRKNFGTVCAVKDISFSVDRGEIFALIGPNGAGKSTTLKMAATLLSLDSGNLKIADFDVSKNPDSIRKIISYLPEDSGAYKNLSGLDYLKFMSEIFFDSADKRREAVIFAESVCNLGDRLKDKVKTYSKGMTRKLLLARSVMTRPILAILDEPTSGLDVINAVEIRRIIKDLAKEGMSVLLSSHNMLEIEFLADRLALVNFGRIAAIGDSTSLKSQYQAINLEEVFAKIVFGENNAK